MVSVIKRNGSIVDFNKEKIYDAIVKAMKNGSSIYKPDIAKEISEEIYIENKDRDTIAIYEIENLVYDKLITKEQRLTAKEYEGYRSIRQFQRESKNTIDEQMQELLNGTSEYWNEENSNKNAKLLTTQRDYMAGIVSTDITRRFLLSPEIVQAHDEGLIHFHDADYFAMRSISNCFSGDTKFITNYGVKRFDEFYDGDKVKVKDKDGIWRDATVHNYGNQKMYNVTFKTPRNYKTVTCTANHRWILNDGSETTELKVGDRLLGLKNSTEYEPETDDELKAFCFGFIIGDGRDVINYDGKFCSIEARLCGERKNKLLPYFIKAGYQYSKVKDSDDYRVFNKKGFSKQDFLSSKSWRLLPLNQKIALFNGYYNADGHFNNSYGIDTSDDRIALMIEELSSLAGYYIASKKDAIRDTNFKKNARLISYRFIVQQPENWLWKVVDIKPHIPHSNHPLQAWCVEEPITHSFTLANGMITGNCCLINLEDMLQNGTCINKVMIEKPHRFITAMTIATQIITAVTSSQFGGATITLTHLAPFVRDSYNRYYNKYKSWGFNDSDCKKYATIDLKKEISDGVQTFNYQVNSMTTTNGQSPFLSVFMYLGETNEYKEELAMIIEEFLNQRILGLKNEVGVYVTQAFPKLLYVLEKDNIIEDSKYWYLTELAAKCTAKRLVPDYISEKKMIELKEGNVFPCMGCRSFLAPYKNENGEYKFYGRFNQGVVTINLVDVALSSEKDFDSFWELFNQRLELCHKALKIRNERLRGTVSDVAPIIWQDGAFARLKKGERIDKLLYGGYSSISLGYAGLYECVLYMTGKPHTDRAEGYNFAIKVMQYMNQKCNEWKITDDIGYSLYGTPIESTTYKFAKCLKERFGIIEGITDKDYITNSYHVNVREKINPFDKLDIEADFQSLSLGGAISYIETADMTKNTNAIISVLKYIYENIMYAELNTKSDYCQECGYDGEIKIISENNKLIWECPKCGNRDKTKMNVARRTCGYIGSNFWNAGRTEEIKERYVHLNDTDLEDI